LDPSSFDGTPSDLVKILAVFFPESETSVHIQNALLKFVTEALNGKEPQRNLLSLIFSGCDIGAEGSTCTLSDFIPGINQG
jgi:hypothetical protein